MSAVVLIGIGGCVGALVRWGASVLDRDVPWGIVAANISASGLAGALNGLGGSLDWLADVGLLGAMSTWSSLAVAAAQLVREKRLVLAATVVIGTTMGSIASAWALLQF